jgi:glucosamine kinase
VAVGLDLGGTWARAVALGANGRRLRSLRSPAPPLTGLPVFLRSLWKRWGLSRSQVGALVVGSRGIWTRPEQKRHERRLQAFARRVRVISDAQAAYSGAMGDRPGILVLAGTGSIAIGRSENGRWARAGGLGPLLGDEGSAFWIGRQWLRAASRGEDFAPVRAIISGPGAVARIAALAPRVLRRARNGHPIARRIVAEAKRHLAGLAEALTRELRLKEPVAVSWAGSLLGNQHFRSGFRRQLRMSQLSVQMVSPGASPLIATARMALDLLRHG